jgi:PucR family transcriptional regulator, purine catabolism regulatory protein
MTLSLATILELPSLQQAGAHLVAGASGVDNEVRWVHCVELPSDVSWVHTALEGGELVIARNTTAHENADPCNVSSWRTYLKVLRELDVAGLVVEMRPTQRLERALLRLADRLALPVVTIAPTPIISITEEVHSILVRRELHVLRPVDTLREELLHVLEQGFDVTAVLRSLARALDNPVVLEDRSRRLAAYASGPVSEAAMLEEWARHTRCAHSTGRSMKGPHAPLVQEAELAPSCWWAPIVRLGELWGRLHVLELNRPLRGPAVAALSASLPAISIALLQELCSESVADRREREVIDGIVGGALSGRELVRTAQAVNADIAEREVWAIVATIRAADGAAPDASLARVVREEALAARATAIAALDGNLLLALVCPTSPELGMAQAQTVADRILERISCEPAVEQAYAGLGGPVIVELAREALQDAVTAVHFAQRTGCSRSVVAHQEMGADGLLTRLVQSDSGSLARYVEQQLGALLEYDQGSGHPLRQTLQAFLDAGGQKAVAARELFIDRRTLYYRLSRLSEVLGVDLDDQGVRRDLDLALRAQALLERTVSGPRAGLPGPCCPASASPAPEVV